MSKLVFDGVELPNVRRISARKITRRAVAVTGLHKSRSSEVDRHEDAYGANGGMNIDNDTESGGTSPLAYTLSLR
jgi:hypothetical protein